MRNIYDVTNTEIEVTLQDEATHKPVNKRLIDESLKPLEKERNTYNEITGRFGPAIKSSR